MTDAGLLSWHRIALLCVILLAGGCPSSDDDDSATGDDDDSATGSEYMTSLTVTVTSIAPVDGLASWQPGNEVAISFEIENEGPLDAWNYPELRVTTPSGDITPEVGGDPFFGVGMKLPMTTVVRFEADAAAEPQSVEFTAIMAPMQLPCGDSEFNPCYDNEPLIFTVELE